MIGLGSGSEVNSVRAGGATRGETATTTQRRQKSQRAHGRMGGNVSFQVATGEFIRRLARPIGEVRASERARYEGRKKIDPTFRWTISEWVSSVDFSALCGRPRPSDFSRRNAAYHTNATHVSTDERTDGRTDERDRQRKRSYCMRPRPTSPSIPSDHRRDVSTCRAAAYLEYAICSRPL